MVNACYVVIDTNVLVSALITRNFESPTVRILRYLSESIIIPVYSAVIIDEYRNVLKRPKFHLPEEVVHSVMNDIEDHGLEVTKIPEVKEILIDPKDVAFFAVALAVQKECAFLVTGNTKHFPLQPFIVNPAQLVEIINSK